MEIKATCQMITDNFKGSTEYIGDARLGSRSAQIRLWVLWNEDTIITDIFGGTPGAAANESVIQKSIGREGITDTFGDTLGLTESVGDPGPDDSGTQPPNG